MMPKPIRALLALLAVAVFAAPALAHNLAMSVYPFGDTIEGEVYFSDGIFPSNALIEVFGPDGAKIGETRTDDAGFFSYAPTQPVSHRFFVDLGSGHVAQQTVEPADFTIGGVSAAQLAGGGAAPAAADAGNPVGGDAALPAAEMPVAAAAAGVAGGVSLTEVQQAISSTLRAELRPLITELRLTREEATFQGIISGIGFIVGLVGVGFFFVARQQMRKTAGQTGASRVPGTARLEAAE